MITSDLIRPRNFPKDMVPAGADQAGGCDRPGGRDPSGQGRAAARRQAVGEGGGPRPGGPGAEGDAGLHDPHAEGRVGVAGFVIPGNKVDVLLTMSDTNKRRGRDRGRTTTALLPGVNTLAIDQRFDAPADNKVDVKELRSVTLLVHAPAGEA